MTTGPGNVYYSEYLQLNKILGAQYPLSQDYGNVAHDEMLFIIVHQAYELWFKQILHELDSVVDLFNSDNIDDVHMGVVISRLDRIHTIQQVLLQQIDIIETMTPLDFLEFRDLLVPASGFQSVQFKRIEIQLGIKRNQRVRADQEFFNSRLTPEDLAILDELEKQPTLLELTDRWLARMPFLKFKEFDFWETYATAVNKMLLSDKEIVMQNPALNDREREFQLNDLEGTRVAFSSLLDAKRFEELRAAGEFRLSHQSFLAALFIHLYRNEPILFQPFRCLTLMVEIDEMFTRWRSRHVLMVQRMLGTKIGTGGSSGHSYLDQTTKRNRVFTDLYNLSTYLIPRSDLPELPIGLKRSLGFYFGDSVSDPER